MKRIFIIAAALALTLAAPAQAQITKSQEVKYEVMPDGTIFAETVTVLIEDGKEISRSAPHRSPYEPGDATLPGKFGAALKSSIWTNKVKQDFAEKKAERAAKAEAEISERAK